MRRQVFVYSGLVLLVIGLSTAVDARAQDAPAHPADEPRMRQIPVDTNPAVAAGQELSKGEGSLRAAEKAREKAAGAEGKKREKYEKRVARSLEEAEQHFRAALQYDAELVEAYKGLGRTWEQTEDWEKAVSAWMAAGQRVPDDGEVIYGAAHCLVELGRPREAASLFASLAEADPERADRLLDDLRTWGEAESAAGNEMGTQLLAWVDEQVADGG